MSDYRVNESDGNLYVGGRRASTEEWRAWRAETKATETARAPINRTKFLFDSDEDGNLSNIRKVEVMPTLEFGVELVGDALSKLLAASQAQGNVKAQEDYRYSRLLGAKLGTGAPGRPDHGYKSVSAQVYQPDLAAHPREMNRQEAMIAWNEDGGGEPTLFVPPTGSEFLAERAEREEMEAASRQIRACYILINTTDAQRARAADPGPRQKAFAWMG